MSDLRPHRSHLLAGKPATTQLAAKPVTLEQWERIRQLSETAYGSAEAAVARWGVPTSRGEASDLIRRLFEDRQSQGRVPGGSKRCRGCRVVQPFDEYYANPTGRGGLAAQCKTCIRRKARDRAREERAS